MPDFLFMLESHLSLEQLQALEKVQAAARELSLNIYLVGGTIRDMVYGYPIRDLDFAVEGPAFKLARALGRKDAQLLRQDDQMRSAELIFPGEVMAEIAACRSERHWKTGQKPEIEFTGIYEDLKRRDFSMNAIGLSLNPASRGLLLDPNNGLGDIERHEIRVLHNYAFVDDPVRLIRAVRFRSRLRFTLETKTETLFRSALERNLLEYASLDGLLKEFKEIAREENPVEVVKVLDREGLMKVFHPRLTGSRLNLPAVSRVMKITAALRTEGIPVRTYGPFSYFLLARLKPRERSDLARGLGMRHQDSDPWMRLEERAKQLVRALGGKQGNTPSRGYQLLSQQPGELLVFVLLKFPQKKIQSRIKQFVYKHRRLREQPPPAATEALGSITDPQRRQKILDAFFLAMIDGKVKSQKEQTRLLKKLVAETK